jgi:hypothetical protein
MVHVEHGRLIYGRFLAAADTSRADVSRPLSQHAVWSRGRLTLASLMIVPSIDVEADVLQSLQ